MIDHGKIIADDSAEALKAEQAGDRITVRSERTTSRRLVRSQAAGSEIEEVSNGDSALSFRVDAGPVTLPGVLHALGDKGVIVLDANLKQPTFDDVFLNLTGRSLREGAEA